MKHKAASAFEIICILYSFIQTLPLFEQFDKIVLWFRNDVLSRQQAFHFAKKLGLNRCQFVRLVIITVIFVFSDYVVKIFIYRSPYWSWSVFLGASCCRSAC